MGETDRPTSDDYPSEKHIVHSRINYEANPLQCQQRRKGVDKTAAKSSNYS